MEIVVRSWIQGRLDAELTDLFGVFCKAALEKEVTIMEKIVSAVKRMRSFELIVFPVFFILSLIPLLLGIYSAWADWIMYVLSPIAVSGGFVLRERNRARVLKEIQLDTAKINS